MSEEKNTKMPEGFDMSFAEDLGKSTKKAETTDTPEVQFDVQQTTNDTPTNIYEDLTQGNDDVYLEDDTVNLEITDAITQTNVEVLGETPATDSYNIYEDLTHDHEAVEKPAVANSVPTANKPADDGTMEGVMWESEAQMDAYFDGNVSASENDNLTT